MRHSYEVSHPRAVAVEGAAAGVARQLVELVTMVELAEPLAAPQLLDEGGAGDPDADEELARGVGIAVENDRAFLVDESVEQLTRRRLVDLTAPRAEDHQVRAVRAVAGAHEGAFLACEPVQLSLSARPF